jgi:uncharacterized protein
MERSAWDDYIRRLKEMNMIAQMRKTKESERVLVLGLAIFTLGLSQIGAYADPPLMQPESVIVARMENGIQSVITPLKAGKYLPFVVQKGIPVQWVIRASANDLNNCNSMLTIPAYGIYKQLKPGDTMIDFKPLQEGTIKYLCGMGMVSSTITVVANLGMR